MPLKSVLIVVLGGLFGWMLGKLPDRWVYGVIALAILLTIVVLIPRM
ncbi:MAG: hypothetical protein MIO92_04575 [Methanosarcinaceae archaeon]|nr:hypothetical protein [Methanosarcinaceae archaeon]